MKVASVTIEPNAMKSHLKNTIFTGDTFEIRNINSELDGFKKQLDDLKNGYQENYGEDFSKSIDHPINSIQQTESKNQEIHKLDLEKNQDLSAIFPHDQVSILLIFEIIILSAFFLFITLLIANICFKLMSQSTLE